MAYTQLEIAFFNTLNNAQIPWPTAVKDAFHNLMGDEGNLNTVEWVIGTDKPAGNTISDPIFSNSTIINYCIIDGVNFQFGKSGITVNATSGYIDLTAIGGLSNNSVITILYI
jgi:hypothetical protein